MQVVASYSYSIACTASGAGYEKLALKVELLTKMLFLTTMTR
jgi:hypothetical protein